MTQMRGGKGKKQKGKEERRRKGEEEGQRESREGEAVGERGRKGDERVWGREMWREGLGNGEKWGKEFCIRVLYAILYICGNIECVGIGVSEDMKWLKSGYF